MEQELCVGVYSVVVSLLLPIPMLANKQDTCHSELWRQREKGNFKVAFLKKKVHIVEVN